MTSIDEKLNTHIIKSKKFSFRAKQVNKWFNNDVCLFFL